MPDTDNPARSILVVDDDMAFQKVMQEMLQREGYNVLLASNGHDAIEIAQREVPALIFLDVMMPGMSGGMTAHHLSENIVTSPIPIIFLTSIISEEQEMVVDNEDGSYLFLAKPINAERLREEISKVLG
jgi:CheY-like chemotaxis protein